jgi:hypothetical protein
MAVTITTKFYETQDESSPGDTEAGEWNDLAKVVFTSPNMDTPNTAGTRSHVLPGQGDIGLWYESSSYMYRLENEQTQTTTDFYNYTSDVFTGFSMSPPPTEVTVNNPSHPTFYDYVKEAAGCLEDTYGDITHLISDQTVKLQYRGVNESYIYTNYIISSSNNYVTNETTCGTHDFYPPDCDGCSAEQISNYLLTDTLNQYHWYGMVIPSDLECPITFTFSRPVKVRKVTFNSATETIKTYCIREPGGTNVDCDASNTPSSDPNPDYCSEFDESYFFGAYKIQGSGNGSTWTDLYSGTNSTSATSVTCYINDEDGADYFTYYRLLITSNTGMNAAFETDYYAIRNLKFHEVQYSDVDGTDPEPFYVFNSDGSYKSLNINNIDELSSGSYSDDINTIEYVVGTTNMTSISGSPTDYSRYITNVYKSGDSTDYTTNVNGDASTVSGTASVTGKSNVLALGEDDAAGTVSIVNEKITTTAVASFSNDHYEDSNYVTETVTYTTTVTGTSTGAYNQEVTVSGYMTVDRDRTVTSYGELYSLSIASVTGSGTVASGTNLAGWGYLSTDRPLDLDTYNSVVFELTLGDAYNCRLTAWDDVTHSTTLNEIIAGDHCRVSAMAYCAEGGKEDPEKSSSPINCVFAPVHNRIFKGNVVYGGTNYYYGDFDLAYKSDPDVYGDYLIFKPMLYNITDAISYGIHDFVITLHYSYT